MYGPEAVEWLVDASGCTAELLRCQARLEKLFAEIIADLDLHPVRPALWHAFPGEAGLSGVLVLSESHLACHTFPEHRFAAFSLYSCGRRRAWPWMERLRQSLGASEVTVREIRRGTLPRG